MNDQIDNDNLVVNGQPITIVDDFKYLGSYMLDHRSENRPYLVSICQTQTHPDIAQTNSEVQDAPL